MTERPPSSVARLSTVVQNPKRLMLALIRRSPLRSILAGFELLKLHEARLSAQQAELDRLRTVEQNIERINQRLQLLDVHHEWFSGVQRRADAHHDWISGQQVHLDELQRHAGDAVARTNTANLHISEHSDRISLLERSIDIQSNLLHFFSLSKVAEKQDRTNNTDPYVLFDIRITQIERRERGISRYTTSLALALGALMPNKVAFLIDPSQPMPDNINELRSCGRIIRGISEINDLHAITHYIQGCIFHLSNSIEDLFPIEIAKFQPLLWAICYDLVPLLFPDKYLPDRFSSTRYNSLVKALPFIDRHLAISQATASDLMRLVSIPSNQVSVIMGGIDTHRWPDSVAPPAAFPLTISNEEGEDFTLSSPFWLYVGGNDFRKNVRGLIEGFGLLLQRDLLVRPQLVIACHMPEEIRAALYKEAADHSIVPHVDLVITGRVDDATLATCYKAAFATIFPSLYEGLGLPVLESYFFGTPAIASNSSSLQEITAPACQFDPTQATSIADAMHRMHQDPSVREASLAWGKDMLKLCDWAAIARRVVLLLEDDLRPRRENEAQLAPRSSAPPLSRNR